jgi:hypothetical protein
MKEKFEIEGKRKAEKIKLKKKSKLRESDSKVKKI